VVIEVHGDSIPVGISTSLLRDFENRVRGVVTNFRSLSVIKKLSEQVKMSQHLAALGEMAAGIAHEIRNPLNSIRGFAQLLENYVPKDDQEKADEANGYINIVIEEVDRMNQLVQDLLDFSRQRELTMAKVDMVKLAQDVLAELQPDLSQANAHIDTEFESNLTPVMANVAKLKQVMVNIVRNALQAMLPPVAPNDRPVRLGVRVRGVGEGDDTTAIQVEVSDSGMGITNQEGDRIFEPFFTTRERGTGLGLAICRKIVEQHGGMIDYETQLGVGTTMRVTLPVK
jgi:signal transduction histidine kinase